MMKRALGVVLALSCFGVMFAAPVHADDRNTLNPAPETENSLPTIALFGLGSILVACGTLALTRREPARIL